MNKILLSFTAFLLVSALSAQSLQVLDHNNNDVTGKTITVYSANVATDFLDLHLKVKNTGTTDLNNVFLRRINITQVPNSYNSFCFGVNCYPPFIDTSQIETPVIAGGMDTSFIGDYYPSGGRGVTSVLYEFYDIATTGTKIAASVTVNYAIADVVDIYDHEGNTVNGTAISVHSSESGIATMEAKLKIKNNSGSELAMYVRRISNTVVPNTSNSFCFGVNCYPPFVDTSQVVTIIPDQGIDSSFVADYMPDGHGGATSLTYEFYDNTTLPSPVAFSVTVEFSLSGVGMPEVTNMIFNGPYPNPASQFTTFEYKLPANARSASVSVRNMLGSEVASSMLDLNSGKAVVNTSSLPSGLYVYSLIVDNKVTLSKKLVVKH